MNSQFPVYTTENECQDCYKCVRHCHCKAIQIVNARAAVIPQMCVCCGVCVKVCPAHAKKIRSDLGRAKYLIEQGETVYASIAPSFVGYFPHTSINQLTGAIKQLGFAGVSETALGAQLVSAQNATELAAAKPGVYISSACPAAVDYISKYLPQWKSCITELASPVQAHAKLLRKTYGDKIKVIFFGPCAAKKNEADRNPAVLNLALTFQDLSAWLEEKNIDLNAMPETQTPVPEPAQEGRFYSLEGGMNDTMRSPDVKVHLIAVSGLPDIARVLESSDQKQIESLGGKLFIEALACDGGCVNGPVMPVQGSGVATLMQTAMMAPNKSSIGRKVPVDIRQPIITKPVDNVPKEEWIIREALESIGKHSVQDELNCGGCGYNTCRQFAQAMIDGKAEPNMCLSQLRKIAQKTSNALIRYIPAAVVLADKNLVVIECNRMFAQMAGEDSLTAFDSCGTLSGAFLSTMIEFSDLFDAVLKSGEDIERTNQIYGDRVLHINVFSITPGQTVGGVIQDVTESELRREQVAEKAREVIRKNVITVQNIARCLGEHMADTEILLNEVAGAYTEHK